MKIYVASSWKNLLQPAIVHILRRIGHDVYDFRNPPGGAGFGWEQVDPDWKANGGLVTPARYEEILKHPIADAGYQSDITALRECEAVVYILPCGRSASWEFGYAMGQGKKGYVCMFESDAPDLMFKEATLIKNVDEIFTHFGLPKE